jgi:hypothetical protein
MVYDGKPTGLIELKMSWKVMEAETEEVRAGTHAKYSFSELF